MTFTISIGAYGGFYWNRGFTTRLCLGWIAFTVWPFDVDFYIERQIKEIASLRADLANLLLLVGAATPIAAFDLATTWRTEQAGYQEEIAALRQELASACNDKPTKE